MNLKVNRLKTTKLKANNFIPRKQKVERIFTT